MRRIAFALIVIGVSLFLAATALAGGRPLSTDLTGANEVPGPGDPNGSGSITLTLNPGTQTVCYEAHVEDLSSAVIAGHIHAGTADVAGPIVVDLMPSVDADGDASACVTGARATLRQILMTPSAYYVNFHTVDFPAGAVRGQLG